jgi:alanyl-tRNA synthetase
MAPRTAGDLRAAFREFFEDRGHTAVPSAGLIPHDPTVLFTVAGMVPFKPYFVGDETPPYSRAVSVQKCVRVGGKHNDLDDIGRTNRHFSFFEMLGNFSFGDYFKAEAIQWAWEFLTDVLELDPERLWVTVHVSDDDAEGIWRRSVGFPAARIQRLDEDNFWRMADTGPCGPSSEIFWDLGERFGAGGGPAHGDADRYVELWNLVFMQSDQRADGIVPLPRPSIDTGAGLERNLMALQGVDSIFDIDVLAPLVAAAEQATGVRYGREPALDVSLRILAEHSRTMAFLVADGVVPSNEERGYVLRRIIRRAVRHAYLLGAQHVVTPTLVDATVGVMSDAYPELRAAHDLVTRTVRREEERFRDTLERGLDLLDDLLQRGDVGGQDVFFLHDSLGFPVDLTREIAEERGRTVDVAGFESRMDAQRARAASARKASAGPPDTATAVYRELLEEIGPTEFTGRMEYETPGALVRGLVVDGARVDTVSGGPVAVVLDRTPFYAEAGGQVGDTGTLRAERGTVQVLDTTYGLPGVVVHHGKVTDGDLHVGDPVLAQIDGERRDRIRRNHTATHILHWALRQVLGSHVQQKGSLVAPDRLRFDFSHFEAVTPEELERVEDLTNREIITDAPVRHYETTKDHADVLGAIAFFGDKYGDLVRVLEAGEHSLELCGGTHVHALGFIGPVKIVGESSIGANLRRIEAVTGDAAFEHIRAEEHMLRATADALKVKPEELPGRVERLREELRAVQAELAAQRDREITIEAAELAASAIDGVVVEERDGRTNDELRRLAVAARDALGHGVVGLVGVSRDGTSAAVAVAISRDLVDQGVAAAAIALPAAKVLGGGTGKKATDVAVGGGRNASAVHEARAILAREAKAAVGTAGDR